MSSLKICLLVVDGQGGGGPVRGPGGQRDGPATPRPPARHHYQRLGGKQEQKDR